MEIEKHGWDHPNHVAGCVYGVMVHGEVAGVEEHCRSLNDSLDWVGLIPAGAAASLDRYIGCYEPYFNSYDTCDRDGDVQEEGRNVLRAVVEAVRELRAGRLSISDEKLVRSPPK